MTARLHPHHMLVLVHGQLAAAGEDHLSQVPLAVPKDANLFLLKTDLSGCNGRQSYVSIDWEAEKVVQEVLAVLQMCKSRDQPISEISFFGFNIGGLVARYAVGILYQMKVFSEVRPRNFDTFGTPHIGLPVPWNRFKKWLVRKVYSPSMEQLMHLDDWEDSGRSILDVMSDTSSVFYRGLRMFESIRIYANAMGDSTVPYVSAAIEGSDPFVDYKNSRIVVEACGEASRYPSLISSWDLPMEPQHVPHPVLRHLRRILCRRSTVYIAFLTIIIVGAIWAGQIFIDVLLYLAASFLYLATITLVPALLSSMAIRTRNCRLNAERQRLLNMSRVFASQDEIAEDGYELKTKAHTPGAPQVIAPHSANGILSRFTPAQLHGITNLNTLPQLRKELIWRPGCFTPHRALLGLGVFGKPSAERAGILRHWGDGLLY